MQNIIKLRGLGIEKYVACRSSRLDPEGFGGIPGCTDAIWVYAIQFDGNIVRRTRFSAHAVDAAAADAEGAGDRTEADGLSYVDVDRT
jgi:hypothetical protein